MHSLPLWLLDFVVCSVALGFIVTAYALWDKRERNRGR